MPLTAEGRRLQLDCIARTRVAAGELLIELVGFERAVITFDRLALDLHRHFTAVAFISKGMVSFVFTFPSAVVTVDSVKEPFGRLATFSWQARSIGSARRHLSAP
jgi:nicotinate-nucleotide pyrophosphorylase